MELSKEYYAFISYKSEDVEWAIWLQHELEHYHLPASFNGRTDIRQELRPVFRDIDELSAGNLPEQIKRALENSQNLIVVCSPQAAASPWVNQEVETFISLGRTKRIFPFIVEGNSPYEFFPPALLELPKNEERLGGDAAKQGRDVAFVKVVAGMLGVGFDSLWNRYEKEKAEEERKQREQRDNLLRVQSRFLAEKANVLIDEGESYIAKLLALEALPKDFDNPDRPYVIEAEAVLRRAFLDHSLILKSQDDPFIDLAVNKNERMIGLLRPTEFLLWDCASGNIIRRMKSNGGCYFDYDMDDYIESTGFACCSFHPDGKYIAIGTMDVCQLWDVNTGECVMQSENLDNNISSVCFSPRGNILAASSLSGLIFLLDTQTLQVIKVMNGNGGAMGGIAFSPNGKIIASTNEDSAIQLWEVKSGKCIKSFKDIDKKYFVNSTGCIAFSPDGQHIAAAVGDIFIRIWDISTGLCISKLKGHEGTIIKLIFNKDGQKLYSASCDKSIKIWDLEIGALSKTIIPHTDSVNSMFVSSDERYIISVSQDKTVKITDCYPYPEPMKINAEDESIYFAVASPDGKQLATVTNETLIHIWDSVTLKKTLTLKGHQSLINHLSFNQEGDLLVSSSYKGEIRIWDLRTGKCMKSFTIPGSITNYVTFSPDEKQVLFASGQFGDIIEIWDPPSEKIIWKSQCNGQIKALKFSPDGTHIVFSTNNETENLFTLEYQETCYNENCLYGHKSHVLNISFSSDGKKILAESEDRTISVWDMDTRELITSSDSDSFHPNIYYDEKKNYTLDYSSEKICVRDANTGICVETIQWKDSSEGFNFAFMPPEGNCIIFIFSRPKVNFFGKYTFLPTSQVLKHVNEQVKNRRLTPEERKKYYLE